MLESKRFNAPLINKQQPNENYEKQQTNTMHDVTPRLTLGGKIAGRWGSIKDIAINGPWVDVADDSNSPLILTPDDQLPMQFGRAVAP